jgi:hypothetical protein
MIPAWMKLVFKMDRKMWFSVSCNILVRKRGTDTRRYGVSKGILLVNETYSMCGEQFCDWYGKEFGYDILNKVIKMPADARGDDFNNVYQSYRKRRLGEKLISKYNLLRRNDEKRKEARSKRCCGTSV